MSVNQHFDDLLKSVEEYVDGLEKGSHSSYNSRTSGGKGAWGAQTKIHMSLANEKQGATGMGQKTWTKEEIAAENAKRAAGGGPKKEPLKRGEDVKKEDDGMEMSEDKAKKSIVSGNKPIASPKPPKAPAPTLDYSKMNAPKKAPEAAAPTLTYSHTAAPVRTAGESSAEAGFKVPKEKTKVLGSSAFRTKLADQRRAAGVIKAHADIDALLEKADKDELFPEAKAEMPQMASWAPDKTSAADSVYYSLQRLQEIKNQSYMVANNYPEAKKALEHLYEAEKDKLAKQIKCFKEAKPRKEMTKSEVFAAVSAETLTKSLQSIHSDAEITVMLKTAYDQGKIHRNVLMEWSNHRTVNPAVVALVKA